MILSKSKSTIPCATRSFKSVKSDIAKAGYQGHTSSYLLPEISCATRSTTVRQNNPARQYLNPLQCHRLQYNQHTYCSPSTHVVPEHKKIHCQQTDKRTFQSTKGHTLESFPINKEKHPKHPLSTTIYYPNFRRMHTQQPFIIF